MLFAKSNKDFINPMSMEDLLDKYAKDCFVTVDYKSGGVSIFIGSNKKCINCKKDEDDMK